MKKLVGSHGDFSRNDFLKMDTHFQVKIFMTSDFQENFILDRNRPADSKSEIRLKIGL